MTNNIQTEAKDNKYVIYYDYTDDYGYECCNCQDVFYGDWFELQECIKSMRRNGCYNIDAVAVEC